MAERKIKEEKKMHIPIWLLAIAGVIGFIFLTPYRQGLTKIFSTIWDLICGSAVRLWDFIRGVSPTGATTTTILDYTGMALMFIALAVILFVSFLYFIIGVTIMGIGIVTGHWLAASLLLLTLSIWGMLSTFPSFLFFKPLAWTSRWIARPIAIALFVYLAVVSTWWVFGNISPRLQGSLGRSAENTTTEFANKLDKGSLKSEPEMGKFARVIEDSQIYNQSGQPVFSVQRGTTVMVKDLDGKKADADSEGMTKVMCPDRQGDYQRGNEGWIPTRKLDWDWQSKVPPESTNPSAANTPNESWTLCWQKPDAFDGENPAIRSRCFNVSLNFFEENRRLEVVGAYEQGQFVFTGERIGENEYGGSWKNPRSPTAGFLWKFSQDLCSAKGWVEDATSHVKSKIWLTKT